MQKYCMSCFTEASCIFLFYQSCQLKSQKCVFLVATVECLSFGLYSIEKPYWNQVIILSQVLYIHLKTYLEGIFNVSVVWKV